MLILNDVPAWHWSVAGAAIGVITLLLLFVANRRLGISTTYEDLCALGSRLPYFQRPEISGSGRWRLYFAAGLLLGGVLSAAASGGWHLTWSLGAFDAVLALSPGAKLAWMFGGGVLIGLGTRLAGGCTSGHGIFGLANLEPASWISTVSFMAAGIAVTHLVHRVLFAGGAQ